MNKRCQIGAETIDASLDVCMKELRSFVYSLTKKERANREKSRYEYEKKRTKRENERAEYTKELVDRIRERADQEREQADREKRRADRFICLLSQKFVVFVKTCRHFLKKSNIFLF